MGVPLCCEYKETAGDVLRRELPTSGAGADGGDRVPNFPSSSHVFN